MARKRRGFSPFVSQVSLERLDLRISPSALGALGAVAEVSTTIAGNHHDISPADSGDEPPVIQPTLPGTGPGGPGTSS